MREELSCDVIVTRSHKVEELYIFLMECEACVHGRGYSNNGD